MKTVDEQEDIGNGKDDTEEEGKEDSTKEKSTSSRASALNPYMGIFIISKREFFANLKSVRMLVLMLLFILAVVGGAYGISGLGTSTETLPDVKVLAWATLVDYDGYGYPNDIVVLVTDETGIPRDNVNVEYLTEEEDSEEVFFNGYTDQNGVVVINNISFVMVSTHSFRVTYDTKQYENVRRSYALELSPKPAYILAHVLDMDDDNVEDDVLLLVMDGKGTVLTGVDIYVSASDYENHGTTDSIGTADFRNLKTGGTRDFDTAIARRYTVEITYSGETSTNDFYIVMDDDTVAGLFDLNGPDEVLYFIAALFIIMLGPIIAISLSFDSIAKEKIQKSLDFLLCRPTGRRNIILGKFLGILAAIALPVTAVNLVAVAIISSITQKSPSGALVAGFIVYTILFIAIYILLQQIFSTLARTTGTAILSGIAIWLIFNLFWSLISVAAGALMGYQFGSDAWITMNSRLALANPSGAYQLALGFLLPTEQGVESTVLGIESWWAPAAIFLWLILLFVLSTEIFKRKTNS
jgi:ABC-type transport system involved in multi-copper enzyme maturation permease subunit